MGTFSPTHWFIVLVMITPLMALLVVPTWRILQRAGFNGAWALLMLVPVVGLLVPWVVSFLKWPNDREQRTTTSKGGVIVGLVLLPIAIAVLALVSRSAMGPVDVTGPVTLAPSVAQPAKTSTALAEPNIAQPTIVKPETNAGGFDPSTARKID